MLEVQVIEEPAAAAAALDGIRAALLAELSEPASAAELAGRVGQSRQKVNYHLRILESHGLVRAAGQRKWGGLTERLLVATAASYAVSPGALGGAGSDPARTADRLSAGYLIALAGRMVREVGELSRRADRKDKRLATLAIDTEIAFATAGAAGRLRGRADGGRHRPGGALPRPHCGRRPPAPARGGRPPDPTTRGGRMTAQDDDRTVEAQIEVPGTPEQVWDAIATGQGITAWFVPTDCDEREGGDITQHHGPGAGMEIQARITGWEPPRRLAYETDGWVPDEGADPRRMATEFLVEARSGGTCVVRVVNSGFGSGEEWDQAIESTRAGWGPALASLRLYLEHFAGRGADSILAGGMVPGTREDAWATVLRELGLPDAGPGDRVATTAAGAPDIAGTVEFASRGQMVLRLERPGPGLGMVGAGGPGRQAYAFLRAQLFGEQRAELAALEGPVWQSWVQERFPAPEDMDSGARMVDLSVEVPVSPGQAWQAIATGPGIEAWFTPTELEEWEGGAIVTDHGPYGKSTGVVTAWDPPRRFAYEERDWDPGAPDAPPWATEILVQAAAGGTSIVRLVSGFARGGASWEDEIAGTREGWGSGLRNLRLYLTHFAGLAAAAGMVAASVDADGPAALARASAAPLLQGGQVEDRDERTVTVRGPGARLAVASVWPADGSTRLAVHLYAYGRDAVAERDRLRAGWEEWIGQELGAPVAQSS